MCDWKALRAQLAVSDFLEPGDDLTTQRGIIATAVAISERMFYSVPGTWTPSRLRDKARQAPALALDASEPTEGPAGGLKVQASPEPRLPPGGGIALRVPVPEVADPWF